MQPEPNKAREFSPGSLLKSQQSGLVVVILALGTLLSIFAGHYRDPSTGGSVNLFLNANTLLQVASDASLFAIMAVGATIVIISGGIDLSVGSIYAVAAVLSAMLLKSMGLNGTSAVWVGLPLCIGIGVTCGALNGLMVSLLQVHPFIITLGTMWVFRGISYVTSKAVSIPVPEAMIDSVKATLGFGPGLYPVPTIAMLAVTAAGALYLSKTIFGRNIYATGGNFEASRYSGIRVGRVQVNVFVISGFCAGLAAFVGSGYYGAASSADATGYELKVIASAVVGGASLTGGKGTALGALLGAVVITLIQQAITTLHMDRNYESIIIGCAVVVAVLIDQSSRKLSSRKLAGKA